jgi:hypothetical protein
MLKVSGSRSAGSSTDYFEFLPVLSLLIKSKSVRDMRPSPWFGSYVSYRKALIMAEVAKIYL